MPSGKHDPVEDDDDPASDAEDPTGEAEEGTGGDDDPPEEDDDDDGEPDDPVDGDDASAPPLDRAVVVRFLGTREALRIAAAAIRRLVPPEEVEALAAEAVTRALTARPPRSEKVLPAWLMTIARRRAIKWLEKRKRRAKYEGPMPTHAPREDAYTGAVDPDDAEPAEHAYDPQADDELGELLGSALDRFIGDNRRDRETRDMIRESAEDKKTYAQIAKERKTTEAAVAKRIQRFKEKYADRVKRRNRMMLWLKIGGGALAFVVAAIIAYFVLRPPPPEPIGPDPSQVHPVPTASGPDIARPTQPSASASAAPLPPDDGKK